MFLKQPKVLDSKYKYWLGEKPCVCWLVGRRFCGGSIGGPPHHLPTTNQKRRNRDDRQVPVCGILHRFYHDHPEEERKDLETLEKIAEKYWQEYRMARGDNGK